jgi:sugar/nucleoside kinase (ribokinase family)
MDVLIVGSLAYDTIASPLGAVENALGGSATYAGLSCAFHRDRLGLESIGLVGVVGSDFRQQDREIFEKANLDTQGIETVDGETFRWVGSYEGSMAQAITHETHLNVFEHFEPKVPEHGKNPTVTFCANLHPGIQLSVLDQSKPVRFSILDSMNLWINIAHDTLLEAMKRVDIVVINDGEASMLAGEDNVVSAAKTVQQMASIPTLVVKRGEHGVIALHGNETIVMPSYPCSEVVDPTGCGDTFAGALATCLASGKGDMTVEELRNALTHATVTASFTLEAFGTEILEKISQENYHQRYDSYCKISGISVKSS